MTTQSEHWIAPSAILRFQEADLPHGQETFLIAAYLRDGDRLSVVVDRDRDRTRRLTAQDEVWVHLHDPRGEAADEVFVAAIERVEPVTDQVLDAIAERYGYDERRDRRTDPAHQIVVELVRTSLRSTYPAVPTARPVDPRNGIQMLSQRQCLAYLRQLAGGIGRISVGTDSLVDTFPVNYQLDGPDIVFRTDPGTKLAMSAGSSVVFEIDDHDHERRTGWSVVARGNARLVDDPDERAALDAIGLESWRSPAPSLWVRIHPWKLTGRRIGPLHTTGSDSG